MKIKEMTTDELIAEAIALNEQIYRDESFSVYDIARLYEIENELHVRGYECVEERTVKYVKKR